MALKPKDMRRKIDSSLQGKSEAQQVRIIDGFLRDWPHNVRGEYVEIRRQLLRRQEKLQTVQQVKSSSTSGSDDPFVVPKWGHLTAVLLGLPNTGKSYIFHRLGGDGATIADYPFSTTSPAAHHAALDNLRLQLLDLPPLTPGTTEALPYGGKLRALFENADVLCAVVDLSEDIEHQEGTIAEELDSFGIDRQATPTLVLGTRVSADDPPNEDAATPHMLAPTRLILSSEDDYRNVLPEVARLGGYEAVLTKPPGQSPEEADRLWVQKGATVKDLAGAVHKELGDRTTGALVWGASSVHPGGTVSVNHVLSDGDVVELQTGRGTSRPR